MIFGLRSSWLVETWSENREHGYYILLRKDASDFENRLGEFQTTLWLWLVVSAVLLMLVLSSVLLWGLRPLKALSSELNQIESGRQQKN